MMDVRQRKRQSRKPAQTSPENKTVNSSRLLKPLCKATVLLLLLLSTYYYIKSPIVATSINVEIPSLTGIFEVNEKLANGKKIYLDGPECFAEDEHGNLYTGLNDGRVVKIPESRLNGENSDIETVIDGIFPDQKKTSKAVSHGRPLGIRLRGRTLFVMDAYYGFYSLDLDSRQTTFLVTPSQADPPMQMPDDLDITRDGTVAYFSDFSAKYPLDQMHYGLIEGDFTGRVFRYTFATKKLEMVVTGLCSANGVQLSSDEKTILVVENMLYRVKMFDTNTWKLLKTIKVPMLPDNVRRTSRGTYWVAGGSVPSPTMAHWFWRLGPLRQILAGIFNDHYYMNLLAWSHDATHNIAVKLDANGKVLRALHDPKGTSISFEFSHVHELKDGRLVLGAYYAPNLAIIAKPSG